MLRATSEERSMTKKVLAITLCILASVFLVALPARADDGAATIPGIFQGFYQAILEWIAADELLSPPPVALDASTMNPPNQPEIGGFIPPGG